MNVLVFVIVCLLLFSSVIIINKQEEPKEEFEQDESYYQGPVPLGYDLQHFRKTGETILEVKV